MRLLYVALVIVAAVYLLLIGAVWAWQERVVWQPPRLSTVPETGSRVLTYVADGGQPLYAYLVGDSASSLGLLVAFHGNAEVAAWNIPWAEEVVRRTKWAVLLPEYRGYGGLAGSPSQDASRLDALATLRVASERLGIDASRIALYGYSLGTAVATELAVTHPPAALILVAPFTSARDMTAVVPFLPLGALWGVIGRERFDTKAMVTTLGVPLSVAHGDRDAVIPVRMGRAVHAAAQRPGDLLIVPGAGHNDLISVAGQSYWSWLARALARPK